MTKGSDKFSGDKRKSLRLKGSKYLLLSFNYFSGDGWVDTERLIGWKQKGSIVLSLLFCFFLLYSFLCVFIFIPFPPSLSLLNILPYVSSSVESFTYCIFSLFVFPLSSFSHVPVSSMYFSKCFSFIYFFFTYVSLSFPFLWVFLFIFLILSLLSSSFFIWCTSFTTITFFFL